MPYIRPDQRNRLREITMSMATNTPYGPGELNYLITRLLDTYLLDVGISYNTFNTLLGVLEAVKLELYRRHIAPYEDDKIKENGDVY